MNFRALFLVVSVVLYCVVCLFSQVSPSEQVQVAPPPLRRTEPPSLNSSAEELESRADTLRAGKDYLDASDYYQAALSKNPNSAQIQNKMGINHLLMQRFKEAQKNFDQAVKLDRGYADAYNNLGVVEYIRKRYDRAIKRYEKALSLKPGTASYFGNMGAAYFGKKEWEKASQAYDRAVQLDPDIFERNSRTGVAGQISSPEDRAHFEYVLAKLYAKQGLSDRSLECLRKAMEEGYKSIDDVYKDVEFAELRKDPRFTQLMEARPASIPQ